MFSPSLIFRDDYLSYLRDCNLPQRPPGGEVSRLALSGPFRAGQWESGGDGHVRRKPDITECLLLCRGSKIQLSRALMFV